MRLEQLDSNMQKKKKMKTLHSLQQLTQNGSQT